MREFWQKLPYSNQRSLSHPNKEDKMKDLTTKQLEEMLIYKLEKEIKDNVFQLDKDELIEIIRRMQTMINKCYTE